MGTSHRYTVCTLTCKAPEYIHEHMQTQLKLIMISEQVYNDVQAGWLT